MWNISIYRSGQPGTTPPDPMSTVMTDRPVQNFMVSTEMALHSHTTRSDNRVNTASRDDGRPKTYVSANKNVAAKKNCCC